MAFPTWTVTQSQESAVTRDHDVLFPTGSATGDLLLTIITLTGNQVLTWNEGFSQIANEVVSTTAGTTARFKVGIKRADGTETAQARHTTPGFVQSTHITYRISGDNSATPTLTTFDHGEITAFPNPPDHTASAGDKLYIASAGYRDGTADVTAYPTDYTDGLVERVNSSGGPGTAAAVREVSTTSDDPGTFGLDAAEAAGTITISILGGAGATTFDISVADSLGLTAEPGRVLVSSRGVETGVGISDSAVAAFAIAKALVEGAGLSDVPAATKSLAKAISAGIGLTDVRSYTSVFSFAKSVADAIGLSQEETAQIPITFARSIVGGVGLTQEEQEFVRSVWLRVTEDADVWSRVRQAALDPTTNPLQDPDVLWGAIPAFLPAQDTGLIAYMDPLTNVVLNGDGVSAWGSQNGADSFDQTTMTKQPYFIEPDTQIVVEISGQQGLRFDSTANSVLEEDDISSLPGTADIYFGAVLQVNDITNKTHAILGEADGLWSFTIANGTPVIKVGSDTLTFSSLSLDLNIPVLFETWRDGTSVRCRVNNATDTDGQSSSRTFGATGAGVYIGNSTTASTWFGGKLGGMVLSSRIGDKDSHRDFLNAIYSVY